MVTSSSPYPFSWAKSVLMEFYNKYARATDFLCRDQDFLTSKELIWAIQTNSPLWRMFKRMVKELDAEIRRGKMLDMNARYQMLRALEPWKLPKPPDPDQTSLDKQIFLELL